MNDDRLQFPTLYLTRFAEGFGFVTLITLLPYYINEHDGGVASSFGIRELVWRPGSVIAPLLGG